MNEDELISAVKEAFAEKKSKYYNTNEMVRKLIEKGLAPKEAMQALSLARAKQEIGLTYPPKRELCYELLTDEDRRIESRLLEAVKQVFDKKKTELLRVDEMNQLLEENLTPEEAKQAISLAEANRMIGTCFANVREIQGESCYELISEEQIKMEEQEDLEAFEREYQEKKKKKIRTPRKGEGETV